jgi:hypothetical protein
VTRQDRVERLVMFAVWTFTGATLFGIALAAGVE